MPRYIDSVPVNVCTVESTCVYAGDGRYIDIHAKPNYRFSHRSRTKDKSDIEEVYSGLSKEDKAYLTLFQSTDDMFAYLVGKNRKEATQQEKRELAKQFLEAKMAETQSWIDNDVYDLVDTRKLQVRNFVSRRWVLTLKRDKDGKFLKRKARWLLRGFEDKQKQQQQTDSPAASRSGFRCVTQVAANRRWSLFHMDLKTAFLQGEAYDESRDVICQISSELGSSPYMAARLKKLGYGLNDAPRKWWNVVDKSLTSYGLVPTRADRCTYILYGSQQT